MGKQTQFDESKYKVYTTPDICAVCGSPATLDGNNNYSNVVGYKKGSNKPFIASPYTDKGAAYWRVTAKLCAKHAKQNAEGKMRKASTSWTGSKAQIKAQQAAGQLDFFDAPTIEQKREKTAVKPAPVETDPFDVFMNARRPDERSTIARFSDSHSKPVASDLMRLANMGWLDRTEGCTGKAAKSSLYPFSVRLISGEYICRATALHARTKELLAEWSKRVSDRHEPMLYGAVLAGRYLIPDVELLCAVNPVAPITGHLDSTPQPAVKLNKHNIWLYYPTAPDAITRAELKQAGFRYAPTKRGWYLKIAQTTAIKAVA